MAVRDGTELTESARSAVETYIRRVEGGLCAVEPDLVTETIADVRAHLLSALDGDSNADDVERLVDELGQPDEFAEALCSTIGATADSAEKPQGRLLGVPYELRPPTGERVVSRWWNPSDPRIFMPRVYGLGWDLNFGSIAVRLNLIEPDAEDEAFGKTPAGAFLVALLEPVAMTAFVLGSYVALRSQLPGELPVHWAWNGQPDRFSPAAWAFIFPFAISSVSTVWAVWLIASRRSRLAQAGGVALAGLLSTLAAVIWAITLITAFGASASGWMFGLAILGAMSVPLLVLTWLARLGRSEEIRRDLSRHGR